MDHAQHAKHVTARPCGQPQRNPLLSSIMSYNGDGVCVCCKPRLRRGMVGEGGGAFFYGRSRTFSDLTITQSRMDERVASTSNQVSSPQANAVCRVRPGQAASRPGRTNERSGAAAGWAGMHVDCLQQGGLRLPIISPLNCDK